MDSEGSRMNEAPEPPPKRVLIVDDHPITREGLLHLIGNQPDLMVCGAASNSAEALDGIMTLEPNLVLSDFTLPDKCALELIRDIKAIKPSLPILILSMHDENLYAERVIRAGARGYISKHEGGEKLVVAIRQVLDGRIYASENVAVRILEAFSGAEKNDPNSEVAGLSDREFEIFELLGRGISTQQISSQLHLSVKTVEAHRANIKSKLGLDTSSALISYAARWFAMRE
jgi:DNA-binding NarL/FixJ family response regulator